MYKEDLTSNNLQGLICRKLQSTNQPPHLNICSWYEDLDLHVCVCVCETQVTTEWLLIDFTGMSICLGLFHA